MQRRPIGRRFHSSCSEPRPNQWLQPTARGGILSAPRLNHTRGATGRTDRGTRGHGDARHPPRVANSCGALHRWSLSAGRVAKHEAGEPRWTAPSDPVAGAERGWDHGIRLQPTPPGDDRGAPRLRRIVATERPRVQRAALARRCEPVARMSPRRRWIRGDAGSRPRTAVTSQSTDPKMVVARSRAPSPSCEHAVPGFESRRPRQPSGSIP